MLLFEDDQQKRQNALAHLMKAQAYYGLSELETSREHLALVLAADPNNAVAIDLEKEFSTKEFASTHGREIILPEHENLSCNGAGQEQKVVGGLVRQRS